MKKRMINLLLILALLLSFASTASAQSGIDVPTPAGIEGLKLESPVEKDGVVKLSRDLLKTQGPIDVSIRLSGLSVSQVFIDKQGDAQANIDKATRLQLKTLKATQEKLILQLKAIDPDLVVLGQSRILVNSVMVRVDASKLGEIAALPDVAKISKIIDYQLDLSETVPYIGAADVQAMGYTGKGVRIAVLDSGIDYTHAALGGSGDPQDFLDNNPDELELGEFPTAKVIGGYDFVGPVWPSGALAPDSDPLDAGVGGGHGTHVADIIAGLEVKDGEDVLIGKGVAPDASLYAVKVCSSVSTSCSGVALLQGMNFAADPNGDGKIFDHVDIINMSLGSPYGQPLDDDLSFAVMQATAAGILTVTSSGNSGDIPFITGTPGASPTALSTAQTEVPSSFLQLYDVLTPPSIAGTYGAVFQPWSVPLTSVVEAPLQYGNGAGGNLNGCAAFPAGSLAGKIVLVNRGTCSFSIKTANIGAAGGLIAIIGLIAPGDPFQGGFGGGTQLIPGYMISQADSNKLKSGLAAGETLRFDPANVQNLSMHVVGSSSRGPSNQLFYIKPEIGAPGASVSAIYGTGTGSGPFGGTSGAAPMVTGSAALLKQAEPYLNPFELKARLVTNAETEIMNKSVFFGGFIAPISRIGGGEVRVDRAVESKVALWDLNTKFPHLSFGFVDVTSPTVVLVKNVVVRNSNLVAKTFELAPTFRYQNDIDNGAVTAVAFGAGGSDTITVPAGKLLPNGSVWPGQTSFQVRLSIDAAKLREWAMNSGNQGANGDLLTLHEYDGYVFLDDVNSTDDDDAMVHIPWMVLPRLSGDVAAASDEVVVDGEFAGLPAAMTDVTNNGAGPAYIDMFSLLAVDEDTDPSNEWGDNLAVVDLREIGAMTYQVPTYLCSSGFITLLAFNLDDRVTHADVPVELDVYLDVNNDLVDDFVVYNFDASGSTSFTGQNVTWVVNLATGAGGAKWYTSHSTNSSNLTMLFCLDQVGLTAANLGQPWNVNAYAFDWYNSGALTDWAEGMVYAPGAEKYVGYMDTWTYGDLASGETKTLYIVDTGSPSPDLGILLLNNSPRTYRSGSPVGNDAKAILVQ